MIYFDLENNINKALLPLYFIKGDDSYFIDNTIKLFKNLINESTLDFNYCVFEGEDKIDEAMLSINQSPIMSKYKLVIIYLNSELKESQIKAFIKPIAEYVNNPIIGNILLVSDYKNCLKSQYKIGETIDCSRQDAFKLVKQVARLLDNAKLSYTDTAIPRMIIDKANCDMNFINNEINKLKMYCDTGVVTAIDVDKCCMSNFELDIYAVTEAIKNNNRLSAIKNMNNLLTKSDSAVSVIANISAAFKRGLYSRMSNMSDGELAAKLKINPYALTMSKKTVQHYNDKQILDIIKCVDEYEYQIKSGKIAANAAFQNTVIKLLSFK